MPENRKTILITGTGGDIGQSIIKCLKEPGDEFRLLGCDLDVFAGARDIVESFYKAPRVADPQGYSVFIKKLK